jgi:SagB-type dehydrogenase family enzyme
MQFDATMLILNPAILIRTDDNGPSSVETSTSNPPEEIQGREAELVRDIALGVRQTGALEHAERQRLTDLGVLIEPNGHKVCGYHSATRDHPFLDMSAGHASRQVDNELMAAYSADDQYPDVYLDIEGDDRFELEHYRDVEIALLWSDPRHMLSLMISGTFGKRRHLAGYHDPYWNFHQLEMIFKPVPSGGARHPTEAFLSVERSTFLPVGTYHFSVKSNSLVRIAAGPVDNAVGVGLYETTATDVIRVFFGSMVDRAMFRYRDPRSFRALFVDIGHADAQLAALASFCNWSYASEVTVDLEELPRHLGQAGSEMPVLAYGVLQGWL